MKIPRVIVWVSLILLALNTMALPAQAARRTPLPGTQRIWLEGDSITAGSMLPDARDHLDVRVATDLHIDPSRVINHGVSGRTLSGMAAVWSTELAQMTAGDVIELDVLMNDLKAYPGDAYVTSTYIGLVVAAINAGMYIQVGEITPIGSTNSSWEALRERLNDWLKGEFGTNMVLPYNAALWVGVVPPGTAPIPWIKWQYKADEIHPDEAGTGVMGHIQSNAIATSGWWLG